MVKIHHTRGICGIVSLKFTDNPGVFFSILL